jgi:hypothetical protein
MPGPHSCSVLLPLLLLLLPPAVSPRQWDSGRPSRPRRRFLRCLRFLQPNFKSPVVMVLRGAAAG